MGGDCSLAVGKSGDVYEAMVLGKSTAIFVAAADGKKFNLRANAFTCGMNQCAFLGGPIPDQEQIGADRLHATASGDQVYSAFRNGSATWGIVCSTDSGATWSAGNIGIVGDFPRITVGQDGFVYVAYLSGSNMMLDKFAQCSDNSGMTPVSGFPMTVAKGIGDLRCPVAGLDRCDDSLTLSPPAVDDTNASHLYYSYAVNTSADNENIVVRDSNDGGVKWSEPITLNGNANGRRFMPWVCTTQGTAFVNWYDRRAATGANNDLTDYFGATASVSSGSITTGSELQINDAGTADAQCAAGATPGSGESWPSGVRCEGDSESCSTHQPQLAGFCKNFGTCQGRCALKDLSCTKEPESGCSFVCEGTCDNRPSVTCGTSSDCPDSFCNFHCPEVVGGDSCDPTNKDACNFGPCEDLLCSNNPAVTCTADSECAFTTGRCDFSDCGDTSECGGLNLNRGGACECAPGSVCALGSGAPKYGDYNGNACAAGRFYAAWASATPPSGITPPGKIDIGLFFSSKLIGGPPDLAVLTAGTPSPVVAGNTLTYEIVVVNKGPSSATGVTLSDTLPPSVIFVSTSSSLGLCRGTSTVTCDLGFLPAGAGALVTIAATPTHAGEITNKAVVRGDDPDPDESSNISEVVTTVVEP